MDVAVPLRMVLSMEGCLATCVCTTGATDFIGDRLTRDRPATDIAFCGDAQRTE